ncbi:SOCE-associated regulatory factor of calcium homoeostasis domain-containing protein [Ditylenchus destructor]|nr:SOCE-associated regulatory factor of calcium homoeostasis domain-containing protein [Ditylenchus destructor]
MVRSRKKSGIGLFALLFVWMVCDSSIAFAEAQRVLLRDVTSITLNRGVYTNGRRSAPVPQLQCTGGTANGKYAPKTVQCYNRGFDGVDVQWECKADMPLDFQFGKISVSCEGYEYPNDPYILANSCGLEYELDYSASGTKKGAYGKPSAPYHEEQGIGFAKVVYFFIACFIIYLIYTSLTAPREGAEGDRRRQGGGFDHGPGHPPGGAPPPGWRAPPPSAPPPYDESWSSKTGGTSNTAGAGAANAGGTGGPGFFTGETSI